MGMSASQARLLFITSRQHDVEFKSQQIANQKIRLASDTEELANNYARALNKQTITMFDKNNNLQDQPVDIDRLMENGYSLKTNKGEAIGRKSGFSYDSIKKAGYDVQYKKSIAYKNVTLDSLPEGWTVETKNGTKVQTLKNNIFATFKDENGTLQEQDWPNTAKTFKGMNISQLQASLSVIDFVLHFMNNDKLSFDEKQFLMNKTQNFLYHGNPGISKNYDESDTAKKYIAENNLSVDFGSGGDSRYSNNLDIYYLMGTIVENAGNHSWNGAYRQNLDSAEDVNIIKENFETAREVIESQIEYLMYKSSEDSDSNESYFVSAAAAGDFVIKDDKGNVKTVDELLKNYQSDVKEITSSNFDAEYAAGNVEIVSQDGASISEQDLEKIKSTYIEYGSDFIEKFRKNKDYLIQGILMGAFTLIDSEGKQVSLASDQHFTTKHDKSDDKKAEAEYNAESAKLKRKEKILDNEASKLNTEHQALKTEYDSVKTIIKDNISRTFNLFG